MTPRLRLLVESAPDIKITIEQIREVLVNEVLKRDVTEGEKADEARRVVNRAVAKAAKARSSKVPPSDHAVLSDESAPVSTMEE